MAYQERLDSAHQVLTEHNEAVGGEGNRGYVNPDDFVACIKASGGTNEERLKKFSYEELLTCMPDGDIKPVVLAKQIAGIFRGKPSEHAKPISAKRASVMQPSELVESYDPEDPKGPVAKRLADLSRGQRFVVFDGQVVDHESTTKLLLEVKAGHDGRDRYKLNGKFVPVYKVGDMPPNMVEENPFYKGRALRPDGTCDQTNRSWDGVDFKVRQLVRLIVLHHSVSYDTEGANDLMDKVMAAGDGAFEVLSDRYPKASEEFGKLEESGDLPRLKVPLKKEGQGPFSGGTQVICG